MADYQCTGELRTKTITCSKCKTDFPATAQYFNRSRTIKRGLAYWCKSCTRAYKQSHAGKASQRMSDRKWRLSGKWKEQQRLRRATLKSKVATRQGRLKQYGITIADYDAMFLRQGGCCAICGNGDYNKLNRRLHIDHDHATGKVRGLLCISCNTQLPIIENKRVFEKALEYIAKTKRSRLNGTA